MAFLITHPNSGKKVLFDAGARKDYWNYSPFTAEKFAKGVNVKGLRIDRGVDEVLVEAGVELGSLDALIWRLVLKTRTSLTNFIVLTDFCLGPVTGISTT